MKLKIVFLSLFFYLFTCFLVYAQVAIGSEEDQYYDFLALTGEANRPYLNYKTLSDSDWDGPETLKIYGPELFTSYNSTAPYGQNDGALWQGRGINMSLTGGIRFAFYGFEITFKPQITFSQNQDFELMTPSIVYKNEQFTDKASIYGYYGIPYVDAPQRFGDKPLYGYSWGDSEIRYTWKTFTIGFGTQSIWLGPAKINPIIFSNNAPQFPKLDIGLRPTEISLFGYNFGLLELRSFWGKLTESEYFDTTKENNNNLLTGLSISYSPPFISDLVLGLHRTMLSKWEDNDFSSIFTLLNPFMETNAGRDKRDQRASITLDYILSQAGLELYLEWARNDYSPDIDFILRYPFHTQAYTFGIIKQIYSSDHTLLKCNLIFEMTNLESSRDYEITGSTTFYSHSIITQGYTNEGQWLGAGIGTGGNSQLLGAIFWFKDSNIVTFFQRRNPDNDYVWFNADSRDWEYSFKTELSLGIQYAIKINKIISFKSGCIFIDTLNPYYEKESSSTNQYNVHLSTAIKIILD